MRESVHRHISQPQSPDAADRTPLQQRTPPSSGLTRRRRSDPSQQRRESHCEQDAANRRQHVVSEGGALCLHGARRSRSRRVQEQRQAQGQDHGETVEDLSDLVVVR